MYRTGGELSNLNFRFCFVDMFPMSFRVHIGSFFFGGPFTPIPRETPAPKRTYHSAKRDAEDKQNSFW